MGDIPWGKLAAVAGVIFAITFVVGMLFAGPDIEGDDPDDEIINWFDDSAHQNRQIAGGYVMLVAGVTFLWFVGHVRARIVAAEGAPGQLGTIAFASGVVFVALLLAGTILWIGVAGAKKFGDTPIPKDADILRQVPQAGYGFVLLAGAWAASLAIATTSWAILRTGVFGRWLAWLGFVCAIALLFGVIWFPMVALPIWAIATSVELWRRPAMAPAM